MTCSPFHWCIVKIWLTKPTGYGKVAQHWAMLIEAKQNRAMVESIVVVLRHHASNLPFSIACVWTTLSIASNQVSASVPPGDCFDDICARTRGSVPIYRACARTGSLRRERPDIPWPRHLEASLRSLNATSFARSRGSTWLNPFTSGFEGSISATWDASCWEFCGHGGSPNVGAGDTIEVRSYIWACARLGTS